MLNKNNLRLLKRCGQARWVKVWHLKWLVSTRADITLCTRIGNDIMQVVAKWIGTMNED